MKWNKRPRARQKGYHSKRGTLLSKMVKTRVRVWSPGGTSPHKTLGLYPYTKFSYLRKRSHEIWQGDLAKLIFCNFFFFFFTTLLNKIRLKFQSIRTLTTKQQTKVNNFSCSNKVWACTVYKAWPGSKLTCLGFRASILAAEPRFASQRDTWDH